MDRGLSQNQSRLCASAVSILRWTRVAVFLYQRWLNDKPRHSHAEDHRKNLRREFLL